MKRFLLYSTALVALALILIAAAMTVRTCHWQSDVEEALAIRPSTKLLCVGGSHTGCTWEDSDAKGVQTIWKSSTPLPFSWVRLLEIERRGGFGNAKVICIDCCMPGCDIDEDDILREMSRQWPLVWRYWNAMPVGGFRILREALLPMFRDWVVGETAPHDDRCWTKLSHEQQMKEFPNVATQYRGPEERAVLLDYLNRIRDICQRNDLRLVILFAPLPSNNPQRTFPFLGEWKGILADQGFEVLDCRTVCPDEDFRDSHHLVWWGRERFTDKMLKKLGLKGNGGN